MSDIHDDSQHDDSQQEARPPGGPEPEGATGMGGGVAFPPSTATWPDPQTAPGTAGAPEASLAGDGQDGLASAPVHDSATARRHVAASRALGVSALVLAIGVGMGIGHVVWQTRTPARPHVDFPFPRSDFPGGTGSQFPGFGQLPTFPGAPGSSSSPSTGTGGPANASSITAKVDPAIVDISATFKYQRATGEGTGIVLTSNGEVLTNNHVIDGATSISVRDVGNGTTYGATVVGYDNTHDIAVLQLTDASGLATATIGDSSTATVGEAVLAIGNAGGVGGTPTASGGTISALDQAVTASDSLDGTNEQLTGMIGVHADVQAGDSGGPLVDASGSVLGVDTAGSGGSSPFQFSSQSSGTQGFAVPINQAIAIAQQIESGSGTDTVHVGTTAFLGLLLAPTAPAGTTGLSVVSAVADGAAAKAGLTAGDAITSFGGHALSSPSQLSKLLVPMHPGQSVQVTGTHANGRSFTVTVVLGSGPPA